jgi:hypothetical protein
MAYHGLYYAAPMFMYEEKEGKKLKKKDNLQIINFPHNTTASAALIQPPPCLVLVFAVDLKCMISHDYTPESTYLLFQLP